MLDKKSLISAQKDCASMLGMSLKEYQRELKNTKLPSKDVSKGKVEYDNSILKSLGISESLLKKKKKYM